CTCSRGDACGGLFVCRVLARRPPRCLLFPYPTLFRSRAGRWGRRRSRSSAPWSPEPNRRSAVAPVDVANAFSACGPDRRSHPARSEEHTSELQSREKLVCRLLLEKKKLTLQVFSSRST